MSDPGRRPPGPRSEHAARSDVGPVRARNEDAWFARPETGLYGVADGMGGHAGGEVASAIAAAAVADAATVGGASGGAPADPARGARGEATHPEGAVDLEAAIRAANRRILREARRDPSLRGMGTTLTALQLLPDRWHVGHVGDSRAYLLREGELGRITEDHTIRPGSSTLTRALGTEEEVAVDVTEGELRPGDLFLLATDGLTDDLDPSRIREILLRAAPPGATASPGETAGALVEAALRAGGTDNVTALVVRARPAD